jgi:GntR family transcriptional regulator
MFLLNPSAALPLYRQIVDQIVERVLSGSLKEGDELPSVRAVAAEHSINPMTVSKAYGMLEADGVVVRVRGVGMQIAPNKDKTSVAKKQAQLAPYLIEAANAARRLGLSKQNVIEQLDAILSTHTNEQQPQTQTQTNEVSHEP